MGNIEGDGVSILYRSDGTAIRRFRCDVSRHQAVGSAGKAAVGQECHRIAQPLAHQRGSDRQHLAHAWAASRPFIANHHHVPRFNRAFLHRGERRLFTVKHARGAAEILQIVSRDLDDRTFRREISP